MNSRPKRRAAAIEIITLMSVRQWFRSSILLITFCNITFNIKACLSAPVAEHFTCGISNFKWPRNPMRKGDFASNPEVRRKQGRKPILWNGRTKEKRSRWNFFIYPSQFVRIYFRRCHTTREGCTRGDAATAVQLRALGRIWGEASGPELEEARRRKSRPRRRAASEQPLSSRGLAYGSPRWNRHGVPFAESRRISE